MSAVIENMRPHSMDIYAGSADGRSRAHARSGDRIAISAYLGNSTSSTTRSPTSRRPTPTKTNATTPRCRRGESRRDASRHGPGSDSIVLLEREHDAAGLAAAVDPAMCLDDLVHDHVVARVHD